MTHKKKRPLTPTRQKEQRELVTLGAKQPGVAEALAAYSQVAHYAAPVAPTPPRVIYAIGGNIKQDR